jgi:KDO2-lipid IV(A) lauroyltransferase
MAHFGRAVVPVLSRRKMLSMAGSFGRMGYRLSHSTRRIAEANIELALGAEQSAEERERILRTAYKTFAQVMLDVFWFGRHSEERVRKYVRFDESCDEFFAIRPSISVTAHVGNWEVMGQACVLRDPSLAAVAAHLKNPGVDRVLGSVRQEGGQQIVYKEGAMRSAIKTLKEGGRIALVLDQNVVPRDGGKFVDFFGLPVPMSTAAEKLARKMDATITFIFCTPEEAGHYTCHTAPPIRPAEQGDKADITQTVAGVIETEVRKSPECWLWMYKRWKLIPPGHSGEGFPFYARQLGEREAGKSLANSAEA